MRGNGRNRPGGFEQGSCGEGLRGSELSEDEGCEGGGCGEVTRGNELGWGLGL